MDSFFVTLEHKQSFLDFFCRVQRTYKALNNFAYLIKKRNKTAIVTNDLYLTPINKSQNNVFNYYKNNYIYLFTIHTEVGAGAGAEAGIGGTRRGEEVRFVFFCSEFCPVFYPDIYPYIT